MSGTDEISVVVITEDAFSVVSVEEDTVFNVTAMEEGEISHIEMIEQGPAGPQGIGIKGDKGDTGPMPQPIGGDKAIQFNDGGVSGGDADLRWDKNSKSLIIGKPDLLTNNPIAVGGALNDYLQANIQNTTEGTSASSDWIATNDQGNDSSHYIDVGINSSVYNDPEFSATKANDGYLVVADGDLVVGAISEGKKTVLVAGGSTSTDIVGQLDTEALDLVEGMEYRLNGKNILDSRPVVLYGTGDPPSPTGLSDGTLFIKLNG